MFKHFSFFFVYILLHCIDEYEKGAQKKETNLRTTTIQKNYYLGLLETPAASATEMSSPATWPSSSSSLTSVSVSFNYKACIKTETITGASGTGLVFVQNIYLPGKPEMYCCICSIRDRLGFSAEIQILSGQCILSVYYQQHQILPAVPTAKNLPA